MVHRGLVEIFKFSESEEMIVMYYNKYFPRFTKSNALLDRESRQRFVPGNFVSVKTEDGNVVDGVVIYVGSKYLIIGTSQWKQDKYGSGIRTTEKVQIGSISEVNAINKLWEDPFEV